GGSTPVQLVQVPRLESQLPLKTQFENPLIPMICHLSPKTLLMLPLGVCTVTLQAAVPCVVTFASQTAGSNTPPIVLLTKKVKSVDWQSVVEVVEVVVVVVDVVVDVVEVVVVVVDVVVDVVEVVVVVVEVVEVVEVVVVLEEVVVVVGGRLVVL